MIRFIIDVVETPRGLEVKNHGEAVPVGSDTSRETEFGMKFAFRVVDITKEILSQMDGGPIKDVIPPTLVTTARK